MLLAVPKHDVLVIILNNSVLILSDEYIDQITKNRYTTISFLYIYCHFQTVFSPQIM